MTKSKLRQIALCALLELPSACAHTTTATNCNSPQFAGAKSDTKEAVRRPVREGGAIEFRVSPSPELGHAPAYVRLTLENTGDESVWVNVRLRMGAKSSTNKEVWLEATNVATGEVIRNTECGDRVFPPSQDDYIVLPPVAEYSLVTSLQCFHFPNVGPWRIDAQYQDQQRNPPRTRESTKWFSGVAVARPIEIIVKPHQ